MAYTGTRKPLKVKYQDLGDFGGTRRIEHVYVLEVSGDTYPHREFLSGLKLKWNSQSKTWGLVATQYVYMSVSEAREFEATVKLQKKALPQLRELELRHNQEVTEHNKSLEPPRNDRDIEEVLVIRELLREEAGVTFEMVHPGRYDTLAETMIVSKGKSQNQRFFSGLFRKYGWAPRDGNYEVPYRDYAVWKVKFFRDARDLWRKYNPEVQYNFPDFNTLSQSEKEDWAERYLATLDPEDAYHDGELSYSEAVEQSIRYVQQMSMKNQAKIRDEVPW